MTLLEMSVLYAQSADRIRRRMAALRQEARCQEDPEAVRKLLERVRELTPLLREARELAVVTARYYDRSYRPYEKYRL